MLSLIIAAVVLVVVVYMLLKGWYPQAALFFGEKLSPGSLLAALLSLCGERVPS